MICVLWTSTSGVYSIRAHRDGIDNIRWVAEDTEYANVLEVL